MIDPPRGFSEWLASIAPSNPEVAFDVSLAACLRVVAGTKNAAVALTVGQATIPYACWLQDGLSMNSRLIVHTQSDEVTHAVRARFSTDLRVALHCQDLGEFLSDIEQHRFDFVVADLADVLPDIVPVLLDRVAEHGLLAAIGTPSCLDDLIHRCRDSHFLARIGTGVTASRKSLQHRVVRRGGRRRHAQID